MQKNILLVCTGNTCRSPMAQGILEKILKQLKAENQFSVTSAGITAFPGSGASKEAIKALESRNINISNHCSQYLREELAEDAYIILTMTREHARIIKINLPAMRDKVHDIMSFVGEEGDIIDPYGMPLDVYQHTAEKLEQLLTKVATKIMKSFQQG